MHIFITDIYDLKVSEYLSLIYSADADTALPRACLEPSKHQFQHRKKEKSHKDSGLASMKCVAIGPAETAEQYYSYVLMHYYGLGDTPQTSSWAKINVMFSHWIQYPIYIKLPSNRSARCRGYLHNKTFGIEENYAEFCEHFPMKYTLMQASKKHCIRACVLLPWLL